MSIRLRAEASIQALNLAQPAKEGHVMLFLVVGEERIHEEVHDFIVASNSPLLNPVALAAQCVDAMPELACGDVVTRRHPRNNEMLGTGMIDEPVQSDGGRATKHPHALSPCRGHALLAKDPPPPRNKALAGSA